jgi:hypothetical protein
MDENHLKEISLVQVDGRLRTLSSLNLEPESIYITVMKEAWTPSLHGLLQELRLKSSLGVLVCVVDSPNATLYRLQDL